MKKEWFLVLIVSVFTVALALIPLWYAYFRVPAGYLIAGIGRDDEYGLMTWAKQGQTGHWLFWNPYSLEAEKRNLFNPLFLFLGKMSVLLNNDLVLTFNFARVVLGLVFLLTAYWFFGYFFTRRRERLAAFFLLCFSSGLGWLLIFVKGPAASPLFSAVSSTEALSFPSLLFYPHFTAALTLMMLTFIGYLKFVASGRWGYWLMAGMAGSLLIATHPHESLALVLVPAVYLFLSQKAKVKHWLRTFFYYFGLGPMAAYFAYLSQFDPVYKEFTQTPLAPLSWPDFGAAYGLLLLLAGWGGYRVLLTAKEKNRISFLPRDSFFLLAWVLTVLGLLFVPFAFQRKMVMGLHLPLVILAATGLSVIWQKLKKRTLVWFSFLFLILFLSLQNWYFVRRVVGEIRAEPMLYRLSASQAGALAWLEKTAGESEVVLSNPAVGLLIPAYSGRKVFLGHWGNTNFSEEKAEQVWRFFSPEAGEDWRRQFLNERSIDYYYRDKEGIAYNRWVFAVERQNAQKIIELEKGFDPENKDYLELVFENKAAAIYRIKL